MARTPLKYMYDQEPLPLRTPDTERMARSKEKVVMDMTLKQWKNIKSPNERNCPKYLQVEEEVRGKMIKVQLCVFYSCLLRG